MRPIILLTSCILFPAYFSFSQSCLPEGIIFSSQAQIDSFQVNYPGCIRIEGDLKVAGADITNLMGLNPIHSIGGSLYIQNTWNLSMLTGLEVWIQ